MARPLLALLALTALTGCGEQRGSKTPLLEIRPADVVFPKLAAVGGVVAELSGGERCLEAEACQCAADAAALNCAERRLELVNRGSGVLRAIDVTVTSLTGDGRFDVFVEDEGRRRRLPASFEIPGGEDASITLVAIYRPADEAATDAGAIQMRTNDPERLEVSIPLRPADGGGEILVSPRRIDFGTVEAGERETREISVDNIGVGDLIISALSVDGSADFTVTHGERRFAGSNHDLSAEPIVVPPGEKTTLQAIYAPPTLGPDQGRILLTTNDPNRAQVDVELVANGAQPCIQVIPETVEFVAALVVPSLNVEETPNRQVLSVESCGSTPLRVDRIEIIGGDSSFALIDPPAPAEEGAPMFELPAMSPDDGVLPAQTLALGFWPLAERTYGARMLIFSNATPADRPLEVPLFGRGVENACPIPAVVTERYEVPPLEVITLDGSLSTDPGGRVERWEWTVVSQPDGSTSVPVESFENPLRPADGGEPDDASTPTAQFFVDLAGTYVIELQVYDNLGQVSCDPPSARLEIVATPDKDLHVQLVWSTPADPDETDNIGTDVDLHLRHENAGDAWGRAATPWDCYFGNKNPDWGQPNDPSDNPSLDIDDTNGSGPENINLNRPEVGVTYDIGALYFRAESTFGLPDVDPRTEHTSYVTVRLYARGDLLAEFIDRELTRAQQLWWVTSIHWCEDALTCPDLTIRDVVLEPEEWLVE